MGEHSSDCMEVDRVLNWRAPMPSDILPSLLHNTSGSIFSLSNGKATTDSFCHSLSSCCHLDMGEILSCKYKATLLCLPKIKLVVSAVDVI